MNLKISGVQPLMPHGRTPCKNPSGIRLAATPSRFRSAYVPLFLTPFQQYKRFTPATLTVSVGYSKPNANRSQRIKQQTVKAVSFDDLIKLHQAIKNTIERQGLHFCLQNFPEALRHRREGLATLIVRNRLAGFTRSLRRRTPFRFL